MLNQCTTSKYAIKLSIIVEYFRPIRLTHLKIIVIILYTIRKCYKATDPQIWQNATKPQYGECY